MSISLAAADEEFNEAPIIHIMAVLLSLPFVSLKNYMSKFRFSTYRPSLLRNFSSSRKKAQSSKYILSQNILATPEF
jgi:hypothetical protein